MMEEQIINVVFIIGAIVGCGITLGLLWLMRFNK